MGEGCETKSVYKTFYYKVKKGEISTKGVNGRLKERKREKKKEVQNAFC